MEGRKERTLAITDIVADIELMMRVEIDGKTVTEYARVMHDGGDFPLIDVMDVDGVLYLTNGFHRLKAHLRCGHTEIKAIVATGSFEDAQDAAAKADSHDGLARTNEDKRKVVNMLIRMERHENDSDRKIAGIAGVAHPFVAKLRKQLEKQSSTGNGYQLSHEKPTNPDRVKRKGRDGKSRRSPRKKKKKSRNEAPPPPRPVVPTYTPEQIGWPSPELADLPHPDNPQLTYAQMFIKQHGHVHIMPVDQRQLQKQQMALRDFSAAVLKFGKAAQEFFKTPTFRIEDYMAIAATMENGGRMHVAKIRQHIRPLLDALELLAPFADCKPANGVPLNKDENDEVNVPCPAP